MPLPSKINKIMNYSSHAVKLQKSMVAIEAQIPQSEIVNLL